MAKNTTIHRIQIEGTSDLIRLRKELDGYQKSLKEVKKETKDGMTSGQAKKYQELSSSIKSTRKELNQAEKSLKGMNTTSKKGIGFIGKMAGAFGAAQIASQAFTKVTRLLGQAIKDGIKTFRDFEFAMAKVKAISGATDTEFVNLQTSARELGKSTFFTASQVAQLQLNLSKLGFSSDEIMQSQESILLLSTALGEDLGRTATVVASTIRGFGADTIETARFADVMASAFSNSALDIEKFQTSMSKVSAIASMAGFSFEETTGLLGLLTDRGIEASIAGTSLRNILLHLQDGSSDLSKKLGRTVHSGEDFIVALKELRNSGIDVAGVMEIVDRRQVQAMNSFIDGADTLTDFNALLSKSSGVSEEMAEIMEDTLSGSILKAKSAWEGLTITLLEGGGFMQKMVDGLTSSISALTNSFQTAEQAASIEFGDRLKKASEQFAKHKKDYNDALKKGGGQTVMMKKELSDYLMKQEDLLAKNVQFLKTSIGMSQDGTFTASAEGLGISQDELDMQIKMVRSMEIALKQLFVRTDEQVQKEKQNAIDEKNRKDELQKAIDAELLAKKDLIKVQELLLAQAKELPQNNEAELTFKNKKIQLIKSEIKRLKELGVEKEKQSRLQIGDNDFSGIVGDVMSSADEDIAGKEAEMRQQYVDGKIQSEAELNAKIIEMKIAHFNDMLALQNQSIIGEEEIANKVLSLEFMKKKAADDTAKADQENTNKLIENAIMSAESVEQAFANVITVKINEILLNAMSSMFADGTIPFFAKIGLALGMKTLVTPMIAKLFGGGEGGKFEQGGLTNGGMFKGSSHANGGVKFAVGGRIHEAEGGEAIINKRSTAMFKPMLSAMNQAGGGVKFANGGFLSTGEKFAMGGELANVQDMISGGGGTTQVIMVESDVTQTQGRVSAIESQATF
jgi:TP901 family phage tail tape measure protein